MPKLSPHSRHLIKWSLIHTAFVIFFCDAIACFWPAFDEVWKPKIAHIGVAIAAFLATLAEYISDEDR